MQKAVRGRHEETGPGQRPSALPGGSEAMPDGQGRAEATGRTGGGASAPRTVPGGARGYPPRLSPSAGPQGPRRGSGVGHFAPSLFPHGGKQCHGTRAPPCKSLAWETSLDGTRFCCCCFSWLWGWDSAASTPGPRPDCSDTEL